MTGGGRGDGGGGGGEARGGGARRGRARYARGMSIAVPESASAAAVFTDPLDRCALSALTGRQAGFALTRGGACRYHPAVGVFAAVRDRSDATLAGLAALVAEFGDVALLEADPPAAIPGLRVVSEDAGVQMVAGTMPAARATGDAIVPLGEADAPEMLALATLTEPGPFFAGTHRLGDFFGIRRDGALIAMAGERMKPAGATEVSGVCTHPAHRGQGLAAALMHHVAERIHARGETAFLHAYASNHGAIGLYERLGFRVRRELRMTRLGVG